MNLPELFLLAAALSMDAFAVAVCKGIAIPALRLRDAFLVGLYFGAFQAAMPAAGFLLGSQVAGLVSRYADWLAFALLALIGAGMIRESLKKPVCAPCAASCAPSPRDAAAARRAALGVRSMLALAVATSIDALAVGVSFAFLKVSIGPAVAVIGTVTLLISMAGAWIGNRFGARFQSKAELAGGVALVLIGLKTLLQQFF